MNRPGGRLFLDAARRLGPFSASMDARNLILALAALGLAVAGAAFALWPRGEAQSLDATDSRLVARGETVYSEYCAECHGAKLEGQPDWRRRNAEGRLPAPPHDADGHTWHHSDEVLFRITKDGIQSIAPPGYESDMPGFGEALSDAEIRAVLSYIKSTWPAEIRQRQESANRR